MKMKLIALVFLAATAAFARPHFAVRAGFGFRPAPVVVYAAPPAPLVATVPLGPGPGYAFVNGYWAPAPIAHGYWVRPHYAGRRYFAGYWRR